MRHKREGLHLCSFMSITHIRVYDIMHWRTCCFVEEFRILQNCGSAVLQEKVQEEVPILVERMILLLKSV